MQRRWQTIIVAVTALIMLAEYFIKSDITSAAAKEVRNWGIVISTFVLGLGTVNLFKLHYQKIEHRREGWVESLLLLLTMAVFVAVGVSQGITSPVYNRIFEAIIAPLQTGLFAMTVYFLVSSSYRAFIVKRAESTVIFITAVIVMLGAVPIGRMISPAIPDTADWINKVINSAGQRGIIIGAAIGAIANGLRTMIGIERNYSG